MKLLDYVVAATAKFCAQHPKAERKRLGQFFTSPETAASMAARLDLSQRGPHVTILDPGAGTGILACALIERLAPLSTCEQITLVCYENDPEILPVLRANLAWLQEHSPIALSYELRATNYILAQVAAPHATSDEAEPTAAAMDAFDLVIANPPYLKLAKNAPEALALPEVCYGAPNLYFLFATMSLKNLKAGGQMVYLIPRAWSSGAYFERFRTWLCTHGALTQLHLFERRDQVFTQEQVLQETVIITVTKTTTPPPLVTISQSLSNGAPHTKLSVLYDLVVQGPKRYIFMPTCAADVACLQRLGRLKYTLPRLGCKLHTGPSIDFRQRAGLRAQPETGAIPLLYAAHLKAGRVHFPQGLTSEWLIPSRPSLVQANHNYLLLKRISAKEEPRRLQAAIYLASDLAPYAQLSTDNKLGFISGIEPLSLTQVYGLYVIFNSSSYDHYYRLLNGSTQVNASEINALPLPDMSTIEAMGQELRAAADLTSPTCEAILARFI